jgi:hypothetical protein
MKKKEKKPRDASQTRLVVVKQEKEKKKEKEKTGSRHASRALVVVNHEKKHTRDVSHLVVVK